MKRGRAKAHLSVRKREGGCRVVIEKYDFFFRCFCLFFSCLFFCSLVTVMFFDDR